MRKKITLLLVVSCLCLDKVYSVTLEKVGSFPIGRTLSITCNDEFVFLSAGGILKKLKLNELLRHEQVQAETELILGDVILNLVVNDKYVYVANSKAGLKAVDCNDLKIISSFDTDGTVYDLHVKAPYVYLADGEKGVKIIDISDIKNVKLVGSCLTRGAARSIVLRGNLAYVSDGPGGLTIVDVSDPSLPKVIANYDTTGYTYRVVLLEDSAILADGNSVRIIDCSDINNLKEIVSCNATSTFEYLDMFPRVISDVMPFSTVDVGIIQHFLYVANTECLVVLDVTDMRSLKEVYRQPVKCIRTSIDENRKLLFTSGGEYGYSIFDISQPQAPAPVFTSPWGRNTAITSARGIVYVNGDCSINKIDATVYPPKILSTLPTKDYVLQLSLHDGFLYCANAKEGLKIISPEKLEVIRSYKTADTLYRFFIKAPYIYLATGKEGVEILNLADLKCISKLKTNGIAKDICASGNRMFVADDGSGVTIVDVSEVSSPKIMSTYTESKQVLRVFADDNYLFLAKYGAVEQPYWGYGRGTRGALEIIDITDISSPEKVGYYPIPPIALHMYYWPMIRDMFFNDRKCYLACGEGGLVILDVSDPKSPVPISQFGTCFPLASHLEGNLIYLANGDNGWEIADLESLESPRGLLHADWKSTGLAKSVKVDRDYVFLSTLGGGIHIIDVSNPQSPKYVHNMRYNSGIYTKIQHNYLYAVNSTGHGNVYINDISDVANPKFLGFWPGIGRPQDMYVSGNKLFIGAYRNGIPIVDISDPRNPKKADGLPCGGHGLEVFVQDNIAYTASGFFMSDISTEPAKVLGNWDPETAGVGSPMDIIVRDKIAYIVGGDFSTLDVSNPNEIKFLGKCDDVSSAYALSLSETYAFVCELFRGVSVIDITEPGKPVKVAFYPTEGGGPWDVDYKNGLIYVADGEAGLNILKITDKKATTIEEKEMSVGFRLPPPKGLNPKWYYNELIGKPFGYTESMGEYNRRCSVTPLFGVFDESLSKDYVPFYAEGYYIEIIGCGINPRQPVPYRGISEGKVISIGGR